MEGEIQRWVRTAPISSEDYGIFSVERYQAVSPRTGIAGRYVAITAPEWVNVIAFTSTGHVILVRQYRHGLDDITLEIPSGVVEPGETPLHAAQRELEEETGYRSAQWSELGSVHPNPAYQRNRCYSFLALACVQDSVPQLDSGEDIALYLATLSEVSAMLRDGRIDHALVVAAFLRYIEHGQVAGPLF